MIGLSLSVFAFACGSIASRCSAEEGNARFSLREIRFNDAGVPTRISATLYLPSKAPYGPQIVVMRRDGPITNCGGALNPDRSEPGKLSTWNITFDLDLHGPALGISSEDKADWKLLGMEANKMALRDGQALVPIAIFKDFLLCISVSHLYAADPLVEEWIENGRILMLQPNARDRERDNRKTEDISVPAQYPVAPRQSSESAPSMKPGTAPKLPPS